MSQESEMMHSQKKRLGRGLAALIGDDTSEEALIQDARNLRHVPIELIHAGPRNPRKSFNEEDLEDLARSIGEKGILQPLVVRPRPDGEFEIVAGERRWRAAQRAGIHNLPVLLREISDGEALEISLIENIQRSDLNPLEEARAYSQLLEQFKYTQQQLADSVGKSRSHIANTLRLLNLPDSVRIKIEAGELSAGHARALVATDSPAELAEQIIKLGLSVREAENLTRTANSTSKSRKSKAEKPADIRALEQVLSESLGLRAEIVENSKKGGRVVVVYKTLEQFEDICRRLRQDGPRLSVTSPSELKS